MTPERAESTESNALNTAGVESSSLSQATTAEMSSFNSIREQMTTDTSNLHSMEITGLDTAGSAKPDTANGTDNLNKTPQAATDGNMMMSDSDETSADSPATKPEGDVDPNGKPESPGPGTDSNSPEGGGASGGKAGQDNLKAPDNAPTDKQDSEKIDPFDKRYNELPPSQDGPAVQSIPGNKTETPPLP
jgi:hypothetical protein